MRFLWVNVWEGKRGTVPEKLASVMQCVWWTIWLGGKREGFGVWGTRSLLTGGRGGRLKRVGEGE